MIPLIKKCLKKLVKSSTDVQTAQVELFAGETTTTEQLEPYGVTSVPSNEVGVGVVAVYDDRHQDKSVLLGWFDGLYRPKGLEPGEVCFYSQFGQKIKFSKDGKITISDSSGSSIQLNNNNTTTISTKTININADISNFSGDVNIKKTLVVDQSVLIGQSIGAKSGTVLKSNSVINASDYQIDGNSILQHTHTEEEGSETSSMNL